VRPDISLSSDFIVGFPGETEDDFADAEADRGHRLRRSFSFVFSPRPGTPAANLPDDTPQDVKLAAPAAAAGVIEDNVRRISDQPRGHGAAHPGRRPVAQGSAELMGRTECNRIVNFDGGGPQPQRLIGQMLDVQITEALPHSLRGTPVLA
jgi:tRNA-2-methylthio-N6-dimethylallyladenosine synthase